jgi:hypothetical protein
MHKSRSCCISLLLILWPSLVGAEIYQWTDPRGVIHFTDNLLSVPKAVRQSDLLVIRNDLPARGTFANELAPNQNTEETKPSLPQQSHGSAPSESDFAVSPTPPVVYYSPQELQIVVINSLTRPSHIKHCAAPKGCGPVFRPNFSDRSFIHPSVFNRPRHFTHPRVSNPARK